MGRVMPHEASHISLDYTQSQFGSHTDSSFVVHRFSSKAKQIEDRCRWHDVMLVGSAGNSAGED